MTERWKESSLVSLIENMKSDANMLSWRRKAFTLTMNLSHDGSIRKWQWQVIRYSRTDITVLNISQLTENQCATRFTSVLWIRANTDHYFLWLKYNQINMSDVMIFITIMADTYHFFDRPIRGSIPIRWPIEHALWRWNLLVLPHIWRITWHISSQHPKGLPPSYTCL